MYFKIYNSDGDTYVTPLTKQEILNELDESTEEEIQFISKINKEDTNYWGGHLLIIKGEIVVPRPKKTVETYEID